MSTPKDDKVLSEMSPQEIAAALTDAPKEFLDKTLPLLQEVIGLVQLATAGDVKKVEDLINKPGNFMEKLLSVDQSALLGFLEAKGLWYLLQPVAAGEKITHKTKIEWAKLLKELAIYSETKRLTKEGSFGPVTRPASGKVAEYNNELLREVAGDSEDSGQEGSG
jgi:hypothetical protein